MDHIFLVDDETDLVFITSILLKRAGYEVSTYSDGLSALVGADQHRPTAILLDIGMPLMDSYELCRRLRAQPWGASMAIIALTGYGRTEDVAAAMEAGFDAHLLKPVNLDELLGLLASCLQKRRGELT